MPRSCSALRGLVFPLLFLLLFLFLPLFPSFGNDSTAQLEARVEALTKQVETLVRRVEELEQTRDLEREFSASIPTPPAAISAPRGTPTTGSAFQNQNPDISVIGVAVGKATTDRRDIDRNSVGLRESEIVFSKNISPYSRGNLTVGFHGDHAEVEEGYVDFTHLLPGRLAARIGKFLTPVGRLNTIHRHDWPFVTAPLSIESFLGDHGLCEEGISLSTPIDLRSKTYVMGSLDLLKGSNRLVFNNGQTRAIGGRLWSNTPLNDRDDVNLGVNLHQGAWNPRGDLDSRLVGADLMVRRRFNQFDRLTLWGEWLWNKRQQIDRADITARGYYLNAMYKFKKDHQWHLGLQYDCSEKPGDVRFNAIARSAYLGYWLTENDRLQLQVRNLRDPFRATNANEVWLEFIWGMGPHRPHLANF
jgi:hypothetical protein